MKTRTRLIVIASIILLLAGLVYASEVVPKEQTMLWYGSTTSGDEFPVGTTVTYTLGIRAEGSEESWTPVIDGIVHLGAGVPHEFDYDLPEDGVAYNFQVTTIVMWSDGTVETAACQSDFRKARTVTGGGCDWVTRP